MPIVGDMIFATEEARSDLSWPASINFAEHGAFYYDTNLC